ncbi:unnamed protein product [Cuscuta campestris]|uniref:Reverse transcriptase domain-containing protein n=1 Tax=Cuscuta campestris TaxID=132261 RepID=A0A484LVR1_9ASTE|nr:unnamed protein product [Cuscuta campestris]
MGQLVEGDKKVAETLVSYFQDLIGTQSDIEDVDMEAMKEGTSLNIDQQLTLIVEVKRIQVKEALFSILNSKSPGPDGFSSGFFKNQWEVVGELITEAILDFFKGKFLRQINATSLTVIPKVEPPKMANDYRPIACCNVVYKAISKILCSKLKEILPVRINGESYEFFKGKKGLRQGDPISPMLFILVMEYLNRLLQQMAKDKRFKFHPMSRSLKLVNLSFADDLIIVCKAEEESLNCIMEVMRKFQKSTGLGINYTKSQIIFGGVDKKDQEHFLKLTNLPFGELPIRYLRSPISAGSLEDADHLFSTCPLTKSLLMKISDWLEIRMEGNSVQDIRENLMRVRGRRRDRGISAFVATCYHKQEQPQLKVMYNSILLCLTAYWGKGPKK